MAHKSQNKTDALTNNDLEKIASLLNNAFDERLNPLATKAGLKEVETNLKDYIHQGIDMVMKGIDNITEMLAEKERVDKLEKWVQKIGDKVGVKLEK